jgi:hypothetical protein
MVAKAEVIKQCRSDKDGRTEVCPGITITMIADGFYEGRWNRGKGYSEVSGDIAYVVKVVNGWIRTRKRQEYAQETGSG